MLTKWMRLNHSTIYAFKIEKTFNILYRSYCAYKQVYTRGEMTQRMFCTVCANLLTVDVVNDSLIFICMACQSRYDATDDDSLRYEDVKGSDIQIFKKILEKIAEDPTNPKMMRECRGKDKTKGRCDGKVAKYVRLGEDMKMVYSCVKCKEVSM